MSVLVLMALPLLAALASALPIGRRLAHAATLATSAAALVLSVRIAAAVSSGDTLVAIPGWVEADALGTLVVLAVTWVAFLAALYSIGYLEGGEHPHDDRRVRFYYAQLNLFVFALVSVPLVAEPTLAWIGIELTALFSVLLVAYESTHESLEAAWKYIAMMLMGAAIALLGFFLLFWAQRAAGGGEFTWNGLAGTAGMSPALTATAFTLILVGLGIEVGFVPLHTWLPDAHSQAPAPVCALLSGVKTTVALLAILRLVPLVAGEPMGTWLEVVGLVSVGVAAFLLLQVRDYKRMFAFSTVEHMGVILVAVGLGAGARSAALLQIISHSLAKSFCFFAAGAVLLTFGSREIASVRGVLRRSRVAGAAILFGALAIGGAPPMAVFTSELSIFRAGLAGSHVLAVALLAILVVVAFVGIMRHVNRMVFGGVSRPDEPEVAERRPLPATVRLALLLGAVPVLVLGVWWPPAFSTLVEHAAGTLGP